MSRCARYVLVVGKCVAMSKARTSYGNLSPLRVLETNCRDRLAIFKALTPEWQNSTDLSRASGIKVHRVGLAMCALERDSRVDVCTRHAKGWGVLRYYWRLKSQEELPKCLTLVTGPRS